MSGTIPTWNVTTRISGPMNSRFSTQPGQADIQSDLFYDYRTNVEDYSKMRTHQPGQAVFRSVLPEQIDWKPFPAFPPSVRLAIVVGQPSEPGPYVIRVKVPSGVKMMPHRHPEDRVYTVMSGVFYIGLGDQFDGDKVEAYPPGSVIVLPGNTSHFHWAKSGEYVTQVTAIGPLGLEYLDAADDPREHQQPQ